MKKSIKSDHNTLQMRTKTPQLQGLYSIIQSR
jgi:hypothetical protein